MCNVDTNDAMNDSNTKMWQCNVEYKPLWYLCKPVCRCCSAYNHCSKYNTVTKSKKTKTFRNHKSYEAQMFMFAFPPNPENCEYEAN